LIIVVLVIAVIGFIIFLKGPSQSSYPGGGLTYQVGDGQ